MIDPSSDFSDPFYASDDDDPVEDDMPNFGPDTDSEKSQDEEEEKSKRLSKRKSKRKSKKKSTRGIQWQVVYDEDFEDPVTPSTNRKSNKYGRLQQQMTRGRPKKKNKGRNMNSRRSLQSTISRISVALSEYDENEATPRPNKSHLVLGAGGDSSMELGNYNGVLTGKATMLVSDTEMQQVLEEAKQYGSSVEVEVVKPKKSVASPQKNAYPIEAYEQDSDTGRTPLESLLIVFVSCLCTFLPIAGILALIFTDEVADFF